jgi:hypothetical protein
MRITMKYLLTAIAMLALCACVPTETKYECTCRTYCDGELTDTTTDTICADSEGEAEIETRDLCEAFLWCDGYCECTCTAKGDC